MAETARHTELAVVPDALHTLSGRVFAAEHALRDAAQKGAGLTCALSGDDGLDAELLRFQGACMRGMSDVAEAATATSRALAQAAETYRQTDKSVVQTGGSS